MGTRKTEGFIGESKNDPAKQPSADSSKLIPSKPKRTTRTDGPCEVCIRVVPAARSQDQKRGLVGFPERLHQFT